MTRRRKVTAAVTFMDGKVLVAQRGSGDKLAGKWEFPGGKVERGETPQACLKREIEEELGLEILVGEYLCSSFFDYDHLSIELMAFSCKATGGEARAQEHQRLMWTCPSDLKYLDMAPADLPIVDHICKASPDS